MAGCSGPLAVGCGGTGSWCGCNCSCCPPDPCYGSVTVNFDCGSPDDPTGSGPGGPYDIYNCYYPWLDGCDCLTAAPFMESMEYMPALLPKPTTPLFKDEPVSKPVPFPDYDDEVITLQAQNEVKALAITCCRKPCSTYSVTLSTSGCCFVVNGNSITHIGVGTVTASVGGGACPVTASVNGGGSSASVGDCGGVGVSLTSSDPCCSCCAGSVSVAFAVNATAVLKNNILVRTKKQGESKLKINKSVLVKKAKERAVKLKLKRLLKKKSN